jgi:predicted amidohydrolase YtcJ
MSRLLPLLCVLLVSSASSASKEPTEEPQGDAPAVRLLGGKPPPQLQPVVIVGDATPPAPLSVAPADLVVRNGNILTVDARSSTAEALAVRDGFFVYVGTDAQVKKLIGANTRVIDAQGRTVVPGLIESHVHAIGAARGEVLQPFVQLGSIAAIQEWVRRQAEARPAGEWIQAPRVDITRIRERRLPTRADLDAAAPKHPVVFTWQYASRQVQVLNTAALKAANITRDTPEPKGARSSRTPRESRPASWRMDAI